MQKFSLTAAAHEQLEQARRVPSGRSSHTIHGGHEHVLKQTVIALASGQELSEHNNPGEATLYVLSGRVTLTAGEHSWDGRVGDLIVIPNERHTLLAVDDAAVLLSTVNAP